MELSTALAYIKQKQGCQLDRDLLRHMANRTGSRWWKNKNVNLRVLTGEIVRTYIKERSSREQQRFGNYVRAVMKMFSERSAKKRRITKPQQAMPRSVEYPVDAHGQYRLI